MKKLDQRTLARMDLALEQACRVFPHGGDHEQRKYVAAKMVLSALEGNTTFDGLSEVACHAVEQLLKGSAGKARSS